MRASDSLVTAEGVGRGHGKQHRDHPRRHFLDVGLQK